jgi:single-stranded DNA-binding protein
MLRVRCTGSLLQAPQQRIASKLYVSALVRVFCEDGDALLCSVTAFNSAAMRALLALSAGDTVALIGPAKVRTWNMKGEQKHGLDIVAEHVLTVYQADKRRQGSRRREEEHV